MTVGDPAVRWALDRLASLGQLATGEPEITKDRSWSLVVRLPTDGGDTWLKVNRGGTIYEPALLAVLPLLAPETALAPLAVDVDRGWSICPDGGPTLRSARAAAPLDPEVMGAVLRGYADLQRRTASHLRELLDAGVPDLRPERLPAVLDDLLEDADWSRLAGPDADPPDPGARARVLAHRPRLVAACVELADRSAAVGLPMTLQHDDLHDNNVFVGAGSAGPTYRVFDWGDSCIAHPFSTLLVTLRSFAASHHVRVDHPLVGQVRAAYLECWTDLAPLALLDALADLAVSVAPVGRADSWRRALLDADDTELAEFGEAVPGWLAELAPLPPR